MGSASNNGGYAIECRRHRRGPAVHLPAALPVGRRGLARGGWGECDFLLRLSEIAKVSAWMCDVIAERLAETLGAEPAFSHPKPQAELRETYDGIYFYLQAVRERPAWILDLTQYRFGAIEEIAALIAQFVGAPSDAVTTDGGNLRIG